ncbi:MAG: hypothetical protein K2I46_05950 [Clostridia bacterium]|nr:hypothetical protein [Clostridia bacterium]MDE6471578.1 hypothetical protein [Clostridia bacterium]
MKVIIQTNKIRCDVGNCRNLAGFSVAPDGVGAGQYINLCEKCMRQLYGEIALALTPKRKKAKKTTMGENAENDKV